MRLPLREPCGQSLNIVKIFGNTIIGNNVEEMCITVDIAFNKITDFCGCTGIYIFIIWAGILSCAERATAFEQTSALCSSWGKSAALCFFHVSEYNSVIYVRSTGLCPIQNVSIFCSLFPAAALKYKAGFHPAITVPTALLITTYYCVKSQNLSCWLKKHYYSTS